MKCSTCQGELRVSHTFSGSGWKAQDAKCTGCGKRYTLTTAVSEYAGVGTGARARAKVLEQQETDGSAPEEARTD